MASSRTRETLILGVSLCAAMAILGVLVGRALLDVKEYERVVTAKGLAEREVAADVAIWPISFVNANDDLDGLYRDVESTTASVLSFLAEHGFAEDEVTVNAPAIQDRRAMGMYDPARVQLRYSSTQTVTVYTHNPPAVRTAMRDLLTLGKSGVVLSSGGYNQQPQFLFTGLNAIKPEMVKEATRKAREVADEFARDSDSQLGKIKRARQGQFSIVDRDSNNPHIKKVRVVNTIEYTLTD